MDKNREKMIELLLSGDKTVQCEHSPEVNCDGMKCAFCERVEIADRLLAHGVTFAKDTDAPSKWISVEDRLPIDGVRVLTACDDGLVRLNISKGGFPAVVNRQRRFSEATHWMPLPEPPVMQEVPNGTDHV